MVGCSSGGGDNKGPRADVRSKITDKGNNALTGQTAVFEATQGLGGGRSFMTEVVANIAGKNENLSESKKATKGKVGRINSAIHNGQCQIQNRHPSNANAEIGYGSIGSFPQMQITIAGPQCPVEVDLAITIAGNSEDICQESGKMKTCKFAANMKMTYQIVDRRLAEELQVTSGRMNMRFNIEQAFPGDSSSSSPNETINIIMKRNTEISFEAFDLNNQAHVVTGTQNFDINMTMTPSPNSNNADQVIATMKEDLQYKHEASNTSSSFSANISVNGNNARELYTIDGISVTGETYATEREKFANSMMTPGQNDQNSSPNKREDDRLSPTPQPAPNYP